MEINPAQPADLADRDYTGPASEMAQRVRLDEAWRALHRETFADGTAVGPSIDARYASGELEMAELVDVVCAATLRVLSNPQGYEEGSGAIDDYRETWKVADASSDLYFTAAELRRLAPAGAVVPTAGSFRYC